ncbi:MAG: cupin domain-containing protein [Gammaproteobacteria bacterium]|nr:cupin domain-containing protein [Gammaproteobacteria bacterium]
MSEHDDDLLFAALAGLVPDAEPGAEARGRMRAALMAKVSKPEPTTHVLRADEGEWKPLLPGIHIRTLRIDRDKGTQTTLWRLDPGARVPAHPHSHEEECLVIEGSIVQDGIEYFPGDYLLAESGGRHSPFDSPRGALFLIRGELVPDVSVLKQLG